jgi:alcohol dehydrogenase class IV
MTAHVRPFTFDTVGNITVEWSGLKRLGEILRGRFASRRALIVTDRGLTQAGAIQPAVSGLASNGFSPTVFDGVLPDPPEAVLMECARQARENGTDIVIGIGGGSSLDVAKLVAVLAHTEQSLADMAGIGKIRGDRVALVLVPTTAGTGSEVTNIAIITSRDDNKIGVVSPQLFADYVLLDGELTVGLPPLHTAATGIDAMVHAIEAYTGRLKKNPVSDALARTALALLKANLVAACRDGADRDAREAMLIGAMLAGQAFTNSPVAAVHALAYPLGGHYHVPHGLSNALMLGPVLRFNATAAAPLYAELAEILVGPGSGSCEARSAAFVEGMEQLMTASGAPRHLHEVGVTEDSLPLLASDAMKQTRLLVNNPVAVTEADALALYREAY